MKNAKFYLLLLTIGYWLYGSIIYSQFYGIIPKKERDNFGIHIYDLNNNKDVFSLNQDKGFTPASNAKLLLLGAYLHYGYMDKNLCNKFYATKNGNGVDINIVGGGAFNFNHKKIYYEFELFYKKFKDILHGNTVKMINVDSSLFDSKIRNSFWSDSGNLEWWIPSVSPFIFNSNLLNISIKYKKNHFSISQFPFDFVENIDSAGLYCSRKCNINMLKVAYLSENSLSLHGGVCCNRLVIKQIPVENPANFYAKSLVAFLKGKGIDFNGTITFNKLNNANGFKDWFDYCTSVKEAFIHVIKSSDNLVAEVLLKFLGYLKYSEGSFEKGTLSVYEFVKSLTKDTNEISINDGSGISRFDKVTAYTLLKVLEFIYKKLGSEIFTILPKGGEKRTTLKGRFKNFPATIYAKTGFISDVYALTGILKSNRKTYLFSILYNGKHGKWSVYNIQEKLLKQVIKSR